MVILAAVGENHGQPEIVSIGHDLATAYGDELRVLHVIPEDGADAHVDQLRTMPALSGVEITADIDGAEAVARELVRQALGDDETDRVTPVGRVGSPGEEILAAADAVDSRYLVIGGRKRTPAGKALFGSVTQRVILDSERPVVTRISSPIG